jgi:uncharacterized repeat protein (TIGR01451 family)
MKRKLLTLLFMLPLLCFGQECAPPTNVVITNISLNSANISWTNPDGATAWDIELVAAGGTFTGAGTPVTVNPYTVVGLVPGETYQVCVRSVCSPGVYSACAINTFTTPLCAPDSQCIYTFNLTDTGGDGWNGNTMSVVQNGVTISTLALNSGSSQTVVVPLCGDISFQLYWNAGGQNPEEVGIQVVNGFEQTVYTKTPGNDTQNTLLYQALAFCYADGCPVPYFVTATTAGTSVTVSWSEGPTGLWDYYITEAGGDAPGNDTAPTGDATTNPFTINNLEPETSYAVYVRTNCADMGGAFNTAWSEPAYFTIGTGNFITGTISLDANGDGLCNALDFGIPGVEVVATIGSGSPVSAYTNAEGVYLIDNIAEGTDVPVSIQVVVPEGFASIEAINLELDFPQNMPSEVNACLPVPEGIGSDIAVILTPLNNPQAGFEAQYAVIVQNNSPMPATGVTVTLDYPSDNVSFVLATTGSTATDDNTITLSFDDIGPFGYDIAGLVFTVSPPPVNIGGEVLEFTAVADMAADDANAGNDVSVLNQTVLNSYDPNNITVHEGSWVNIDQADEYLHYTIRFQNTGSAPVVNIRVENELDANLDWDSFDPIAASHDYTVTRREGNQLEFVFENIFLADSTSNEPASHGFVTYRVKPKANIAVNDMVSSTADIYFDFNEPITTNTATTTFGVLGLNDQDMASISLYPNPVNEVLHISVANGVLKSVQVYDLNGRLCLKSGEAASLNTQPLTPGLYMVRVETYRGTSSFKMIKQ